MNNGVLVSDDYSSRDDARKAGKHLEDNGAVVGFIKENNAGPVEVPSEPKADDPSTGGGYQ